MIHKSDRPLFNLLPEIYKSDKIIDAVMAVFEEQFLEMESLIDNLHESLYNIKKTDPAFLDFLQKLVGLHSEKMFYEESEIRIMIEFAHEIRRIKGTKKCLATVLELYTFFICGTPISPIIAESDDLEKYCGLHPNPKKNDILLIFPYHKKLTQPYEQTRIKNIAEEYVPLTSRLFVKILNENKKLDNDFFIGLDSHLS